MADTKATTPAPGAATGGDRQIKGALDDTNIEAAPKDIGETVEVVFDEKTNTWTIETGGLAAARYNTQVEAEANLSRFKPGPRPRNNR